MWLSQSADYALRAVLFLAQHTTRGPVNGDTVAAAIGVPRNYLGKVLHALARARVLTSMRGPTGGFGLAVPADQLTLEAVIAPFEDVVERDVCLLGDRPCDPARPCAAHCRWSGMVHPVTRFFRETTVATLLLPLEERSASTNGAPANRASPSGAPTVELRFTPEAAAASRATDPQPA